MYVLMSLCMYSTGACCHRGGMEGRYSWWIGTSAAASPPWTPCFLALNFTMADGTVMSDVKLSSIPVKIRICIHTISH